MAPEYCPDHSELMRIAGGLEQGQKDQSKQIEELKAHQAQQLEELKAAFANLSKQLRESQVINATERTKAGILFWTIRVSGVAGISAAVTYLYKRVCGE